MIRYYYSAFAVYMLFSPLGAEAQLKPNPLTASPVSIQVAEAGSVEPLHVIDAFDGRKVPLVLSVQAPIDAKLEIQVNTFLLARKLAAPLQKGIAVAGGVRFNKGAITKLDWDLHLPENLEHGKLLLQFSSREGEHKEWRASGKALVRVHSFTALKKRAEGIQKAMEAARLDLAIYGATDVLQAELQTLGFAPKRGDTFPTKPSSDAIHLWIPAQVKEGEITQAVRDLQAPARVIIVAPSEVGEKGVTIVRSPDWLVSVYRTRKALNPNPLQLEWILSQLEVMASGSSAGLFESDILE